jgi:hypothetical protein
MTPKAATNAANVRRLSRIDLPLRRRAMEKTTKAETRIGIDRAMRDITPFGCAIATAIAANGARA